VRVKITLVRVGIPLVCLQSVDCETSQLLRLCVPGTAYSSSQFYNDWHVVWIDVCTPPRLTFIWRQKSVFRQSNSDRSGWRGVHLGCARFGGVFVCAWSTYFWSTFACLRQSRPVLGHFHLYCHAGCICLSLADVRFPGQLLRSSLSSPASRHDLGRLRITAPAVHKIDPWPPLLSLLFMHVYWWERS
jgi:hypothetical protein